MFSIVDGMEFSSNSLEASIAVVAVTVSSSVSTTVTAEAEGIGIGIHSEGIELIFAFVIREIGIESGVTFMGTNDVTLRPVGDLG